MYTEKGQSSFENTFILENLNLEMRLALNSNSCLKNFYTVPLKKI